MPAINTGEDEWNLRQGGEGGRCMTMFAREESVREMECTRGLQCYSPARVAVCRLLEIVRKCKCRKRGNVSSKEIVKREVLKELSSDDHRRNENGVSGHERQEMSFTIAAGIGLLSLIAATKTELDKTTRLRTQMETFLRSKKQEQDSKFTTPKRSEPECAYAVSTTIDGLSNVSPYSQGCHGHGSSQEESGVSFVCDKHCDLFDTEEGCVDGVDSMEEELVGELERLQLDVELEGYGETAEVLRNNHQEDVTEASSDNNNATGTATVSSGEVINPNDTNTVTQEHMGVPPLELERRLHELLEARQEERIKELEAHLECMKEKLQEKEVEVIWWKDTAKLISKQVPQSSRAKVICGN